MFAAFRAFKTRRYIATLQSRGMGLGENVYLNDGFFLDPAHCEMISIEDDVTFGPSVTVLCHDASMKKVYGETTFGPVHIKKNAFIGARAILLPDTIIGENAIIGAGAVVKGEVPDNEIWVGVPARRVSSIEEMKAKKRVK